MHVLRLAVRHWRGLEALELAGLSPGLNLVCGPNESGKSRIAEALWYGLFESSKGRARSKQALASWGVGEGRPQVAVDFVFAGEPWRVEKEFLGAGIQTALRGPTARYEGETAEARLRAMLRVGEPSSRGLRREDAGIWPLLWVAQHESALLPTRDTGEDARHLLHDRLTAEVGEVAAGDRGKALLGRARATYERYYTAARGDEREPLKRARERVEELDHALAQARQHREALAADAERLGELRRRHADLAQRASDADARLVEARERARSAAAAREALGDAQQAEERARREFDEAQAEARARGEAEAALAERARRLEELAARQEAAEAACRRAAEGHGATEAAVAAAEARSNEARAGLQALRVADRRHRACRDLRALRARRGAAVELEAAQGKLREARAGLPELTRVQVDELEALREARTRAEARLQGASVRLTVEARRGLEIDGEPLAPGECREWAIDEDRSLEVAGIARLRIAPGGGELGTLRDAVADARAAFAGALAAGGVASVEAARDACERGRELDRSLERTREALAREAPEGLAALAAAIRDVEARLELAPDAPVPDVALQGPAALEEAERAESAAAEALAAARARRDQAARALHAARTEVAELDATLVAARQEHERQAAALEALPPAEALGDAVAAAQRRFERRVPERIAAERAFAALGGEAAAVDVERLEKAGATLREERHAVGREIAILEDRLRVAGEEGRHERVQALEAALHEAEAQRTRVAREAAAARRLFSVLEQAHAEARQRLARPVIERVRPYLQELFPGSEPWLDEGMNLEGLRSELADEAFEALSGGAREQLSLLVRIGLAEVLGADEPWPLVLDDALVNTDPERLLRLQRVLYRAARRMQILLFTCHGQLFDGLGADTRIELPDPPRRSQQRARSPP